MTIEHVGWEYANGVRGLTRLMNMLTIALEHASIPVLQRTAGWTWMGYYVGTDTRLWTGVGYSKPDVLIFGVDTSKVSLAVAKEIWKGPWHGDKPECRLELGSEACHFFARSKESQLATLTEFVRASHQNALVGQHSKPKSD